MTSEATSIIEIVSNPLGFFVLLVLLVEAIFALSAVKFKEQRNLIVKAMIVLIFLLVSIVAVFSYFNPEALKGARYAEDPEITKIRANFRESEQIAAKIVGDWSFITRLKQKDNEQVVPVIGYCVISKGKYGITISGNYEDKSGKPTGIFNVKQVFINEDGLTYIYEVPTRRIGKKVLGVGQVSFVYTDGEQLINQMIGNWAVLGSELAGKAEFKRKTQ